MRIFRDGTWASGFLGSHHLYILFYFILCLCTTFVTSSWIFNNSCLFWKFRIFHNLHLLSIRRYLLCLFTLVLLLVKTSFFLFFEGALPHGLQDLSSLTRDWTPGPQQWKRQVLTTGPPGNSQDFCFKWLFCPLWFIPGVSFMWEH